MFKFRLDTILRYRKQIEESEKRDLGKIRSRLSAAENKKNAFQESAKNSGFSLDRKKEAGEVTIDDILFHYNFCDGMADRVEHQKKVIKKIEKKVEDQRIKVVEAMRKRQVLSTLHSHRYREYLMEENRADQKFLDEIVATRQGKEIT